MTIATRIWTQSLPDAYVPTTRMPENIAKPTVTAATAEDAGSTAAADCCAATLQETCCAPSEKLSCCGAEETASGGCGCR